MARANQVNDVTRYSRQDVLRILRLDARQLAAWERAGLISANEEYSFAEMGRLRKLRELRSVKRLSVRDIRISVDAMQRVAGVCNALLETSAVRQGSRLAFRHAGTLVDPLTQQLAFDFDASSGRSVQMTPPSVQQSGQQAAEMQEIFLRAVRLEESAATIPQAIELYREVLALSPNHAPALINMGTIHYNMRQYEAAEGFYRRATVADPEYALAFFDLGNVLDEMQRLDEATASYQRAVALVPHYADAHYNLALAYERQGQRRRALRHWLTYVRLDPVGPWASHAKEQARKILSSEKLSIVSRRGRLIRAAG